MDEQDDPRGEDRRHAGSCHCGRVRFAFRGPEITAGARCNCSICRRKGIVMSTGYIPDRDFELAGDPAALADYRWNDRVVGHRFCTTCGVHPFHHVAGRGYRVNLGCVADVDVEALEITRVDGRSLPLASPSQTSSA